MTKFVKNAIYHTTTFPNKHYDKRANVMVLLVVEMAGIVYGILLIWKRVAGDGGYDACMTSLPVKSHSRCLRLSCYFFFHFLFSPIIFFSSLY